MKWYYLCDYRNVSDLMGREKKLTCYDFDLRSPQK